jgi:hypothetical protein
MPEHYVHIIKANTIFTKQKQAIQFVKIRANTIFTKQKQAIQFVKIRANTRTSVISTLESAGRGAIEAAGGQFAKASTMRFHSSVLRMVHETRQDKIMARQGKTRQDNTRQDHGKTR